MTDKTIERFCIGYGYFGLLNSVRSKNKLDYYLEKFNINDYWIYKSTGKQRIISVEELYEFKYSGYIFFKKEMYDYKVIDKSLKLIWEKLCLMYLNKPLPPIDIIKKIKVIV